MSRFRHYSPDEKARAIGAYNRARDRGMTNRDAARKAGVSWSALERWLAEEAAPVTITKRRCLRCSNVFNSTWVGHRICAPCNRTNPLDGLPTVFAET